jgi:uncharacterized membrane protein
MSSKKVSSETLTLGQKLADKLSSIVGSWTFIGVQSGFIVFWIILNLFSSVKPDRYPFMFLNILLSFQAAYTGPVLLMAANRQAEIDRKRAIENLELDQMDHKNLLILAKHIDKHFEDLHSKMDDKA